MTKQEDEIRLKDLLSVFNKEDYKDLIYILDRDQKRYHQEQLTLGVVSGSFTEKNLEQAWNDGVNAEASRCGEFDVENYS